MGGLYLIISEANGVNMDTKFTEAFLRNAGGESDSSYEVDTTPAIHQGNYHQAVTMLSKREIANYRQLNFTYGYHHTKINDTSTNYQQPFTDPILRKTRMYPELRLRPLRKLMCHGEIYNYASIKESEGFCDRDLETTSDVEVVLPMYIKYGIEVALRRLRGDFSFVLTENTNQFDIKSINVYVARDPLGMRSLYMLQRVDGKGIFYMFTTEIKNIPLTLLSDPDYRVSEVPPGCYWSFAKGNQEEPFTRYFKFDVYRDISKLTYTFPTPDQLGVVYNEIYTTLKRAVVDRYVLSKVPVGVLLSGFDSCAILGVLVKSGVADNINVFTIGRSEGSLAGECVEHLRKVYPDITLHHHIIDIHNDDLILKRVEETVYTIECTEFNTIKKSLAFTFLLQYISEKTNIKVLLSGEGLDELLGYTSLFQGDHQHFQDMSIDMLSSLYKTENLKNNKVAGKYNLEIRCPYLDMDFIELVLDIHPRMKLPQKYDYTKSPVSKYIVRKAIELHCDLPASVLWAKMKCVSESVKGISKCIDTLCNNSVQKCTEQLYFKNMFSNQFKITNI
ncbi:hypothetical protein EB118_10475 [bacterium]|nr:hypothetical protein [bacterium]NDG30481.1 hypothetical protein [bacterium]